MSRSSSRTFLWAALLCPLLMGSKCGKEDAPEVAPDDVVESVEAASPDEALQIVSIDPAYGPSLSAFEARIYGTAFSPNARVRFGNSESPVVRFLDENTLQVTVPPMEPAAYDVHVLAANGSRAVLRRGLYIQGEGSLADASQDCRKATVQFAFDSAEIPSADRVTLQQHAACLLQKTGTIRVEGHCDEKGTTAYNLALGERRAHAVRRFLMGQGIAPARVHVISYGEERPVSRASNEQAWAQNRRAEIHLDMR